MKDTPARYIYRGMWGFTAKTALRLIDILRKQYPQMKGELDVEEQYFKDAIVKENTKKP